MKSYEEDLGIILDYAIAYNETSASYVAVIHPYELKQLLISVLQKAVAIEKQVDQYEKDKAIREG
jgi:conjugal transfer/entry exclusion protein